MTKSKNFVSLFLVFSLVVGITIPSFIRPKAYMGYGGSDATVHANNGVVGETDSHTIKISNVPGYQRPVSGLKVSSIGGTTDGYYEYGVTAIIDGKETAVAKEHVYPASGALDESHYNHLTWDKYTDSNDHEIASGYKIYRTDVGEGSLYGTGYITKVESNSYDDTGVEASESTPPTESTTVAYLQIKKIEINYPSGINVSQATLAEYTPINGEVDPSLMVKGQAVTITFTTPSTGGNQDYEYEFTLDNIINGNNIDPYELSIRVYDTHGILVKDISDASDFALQLVNFPMVPRAELWQVYNSETKSAGKVESLAVSGNTLYIGGEFDEVFYPGSDPSVPANENQPHGWVARNNIAAIDLTTGAPTSFNPNAQNDVFSMVVKGSVLYVAGWFSNIGGQDRNCLAALDTVTGAATEWIPAVGASCKIDNIAVDGNLLYAEGGANALTVTQGEITRKDLVAFELDKNTNNLYTTWDSLFDEKDGDNYINTITLADNVLYVGGFFDAIGGQTRNNVAALSLTTGAATDWAPDISNPGHSDLEDVYSIVSSPDSVYIGGAFTQVNDSPEVYVAKVDKTMGIVDTNFDASIEDNTTQVDKMAYVHGELILNGQFETIGDYDNYNISVVNAQTGGLRSWDPRLYNSLLSFLNVGKALFVGGEIHYYNYDFNDSPGESAVEQYGLAQFGDYSKNFSQDEQLSPVTHGGGIPYSYTSYSGEIMNINNKATITDSQKVTLNFISTLHPLEMKVSNYSDFHDSQWQTFKNSVDWVLLPEDGTKTVYAQFKDGPYNSSNIITATIQLKTPSPAGETTTTTEPPDLTNPVVRAAFIANLKTQLINLLNQLVRLLAARLNTLSH